MKRRLRSFLQKCVKWQMLPTFKKRVSKNRFALIIEQSHDAFIGVDADGLIIDWNHAAENILGWTLAEVFHTSFAKTLIREEERAAFNEELCCFPRLKSPQSIFNRRLRFLVNHRDGFELPVELIITPVMVASYQHMFSIFIRNLFEQYSGGEDTRFSLSANVFAPEPLVRRVQNELSESEERFRQILGNIQQGFWIFDSNEMKPLYVSPGLQRIYGLTAEEIYKNYHRIFDDVHPADQQRMSNSLQLQLIGQNTDEEIRVIRPNGEVMWLWIRAFPLKDPSSEVYRIIAITEDITARKLAEKELHESKDRLELTQKAARIGAWDWNLETNEVILSGAIEEVFHQNSKTFEEWRSLVHPDDLGKVYAAFDYALSGNDEYNAEFRYVWPDGTIHWLAGRGQVLYSQTGKPMRMIGVNFDISEQKRSAEALARSKEAAEEASRAKSAFLANMSHEIRTPLGAILGYAELLKQANLSEAERLQFLDTVMRNGCQLAQLIDDILDLSKVEAGRLEVERVRVPLLGLLNEVISMLSLRVNDNVLTLTLRSDGPIPETIESDPLRLRQILINIIGNAIKFTDQGSIDISVRFLQAEAEGKCQIAFMIQDTGCGIAREHQFALFQPFSQADSSTTRKYGGTGLGLALSRRLAQALGGDVVLKHSIPGKGSLFMITILAGRVGQLLWPENIEAFAAPAQRKHTGALQGRLDGLKILLAEDAPDNQLLIKRFLTAAGAAVDVVANGSEAVQRAQNKDFDMILMDIQMPVLDGYSATTRLRGLGYRRPIVALTAHAMKEERLRSLAAGCDDHLTKPIQPHILITTVERFTKARTFEFNL